MNKIDDFRGEYFFLSNFFMAHVIYQGIRFENNEAAFQAAKRLGRRVVLRPDWEEVKFDVMYDVCRAKFTQHPDLRANLLATGDAELVEGNTWNDRVWGVCKGVGENNLGKILMRIRNELAAE